MTCQICKEKPASIVVKKIINGEHTELRLCEDCAKTQLAGVANMFNIPGLFSSFHSLNPNLNAVAKEYSENKKIVCAKCGTDYATLKSTGKVGCADCYETFSRYLEPLIKGIHGKTVHTGKLAKIKEESEEVSDVSQTKREISKIKKQLEEAVANENYELAAEYRDLIQLLSSAENGGEND